MIECYGCKGLGWVDSKHFGPSKCPVCGGTGKLANNIKGENPEQNEASDLLDTQGRSILAGNNKNRLLADLENWLRANNKVKFDHRNSSMNTYTSRSAKYYKNLGLTWVYTGGGNRIHLRKGDYKDADPDNRVLYKTSSGADLWGGYPQFIIEEQTDVEYAKKLITYAINFL